MTLPRGFKAQAERTAQDIREALGKAPDSPITSDELAAAANAEVLSAVELVDRERLEELELLQPFSFSACTLMTEQNRYIITNPLRTPERQRSDVAHEVAHLLLDHRLAAVRVLDGEGVRTCDPQQEEEATALGATLLLPRPLLARAARQGMDVAAVAAATGTTVEIARFRWNITGVARQFHRPPSPPSRTSDPPDVESG
jgi:Zn-dependent peptidase ImmA (M78 family)